MQATRKVNGETHEGGEGGGGGVFMGSSWGSCRLVHFLALTDNRCTTI